MATESEHIQRWSDLQVARAKVQRLESELTEARRLLHFAQEAINAEYRRYCDRAIKDAAS